jgi:hypothetical protein
MLTDILLSKIEAGKFLDNDGVDRGAGKGNRGERPCHGSDVRCEIANKHQKIPYPVFKREEGNSQVPSNDTDPEQRTRQLDNGSARFFGP